MKNANLANGSIFCFTGITDESGFCNFEEHFLNLEK